MTIRTIDRRNAVKLIGAAALSLASGLAAAADYPAKPIKLVVPVPAGGGTDGIARILAQQLSKQLGQSVVVENRPGAGTNIATRYVIGAAPDGYTIYINASGLFVESARPDSTFDARKDLAPIGMVGEGDYVFAVPASFPAKTLKEFFQFAKDNPGKVFIADTGSGSHGPLMRKAITDSLGLKVVTVPYQGGTASLQAVSAGEAQLGYEQYGQVRPYVESGKLRAIGVARAKRSPALPDLPGLEESGVSGLDFNITYALYAPAGTPADILTRLGKELEIAVKTPEVQKAFEPFPFIASSGDLRALMDREVALWTKLLREGGVTAR